MSSSDLNALKPRLREFAEARDWDQFYSPENFSMALIREFSLIFDANQHEYYRFRI